MTSQDCEYYRERARTERALADAAAGQVAASAQEALAHLRPLADAVARFLLPVAPTLDAVVLGGDAAALDDLRAEVEAMPATLWGTRGGRVGLLMP